MCAPGLQTHTWAQFFFEPVSDEETSVAHYIEDECVSCGICLDVCPTGNISEGEGLFLIDTERCNDSGECVKVCPIECIIGRPVES